MAPLPFQPGLLHGNLMKKEFSLDAISAQTLQLIMPSNLLGGPQIIGLLETLGDQIGVKEDIFTLKELPYQNVEFVVLLGMVLLVLMMDRSHRLYADSVECYLTL